MRRAAGEPGRAPRGPMPHRRIAPAGSRLLRERDRRVGPVRDHVDVVHLGNQLGRGIALRLADHFQEFGVLGARRKAFVALLLGGITADVDERAFGADAEIRIAQ